MIAGATYREGIASTADGAVYALGLASAATLPAGSIRQPAAVNGGAALTADGALIVRFV